MALRGAPGVRQVDDLRRELAVGDGGEVRRQQPEQVGQAAREGPAPSGVGGDAERGLPQVRQATSVEGLLEPACEPRERQRARGSSPPPRGGGAAGTTSGARARAAPARPPGGGRADRRAERARARDQASRPVRRRRGPGRRRAGGSPVQPGPGSPRPRPPWRPHDHPSPDERSDTSSRRLSRTPTGSGWAPPRSHSSAPVDPARGTRHHSASSGRSPPSPIHRLINSMPSGGSASGRPRWTACSAQQTGSAGSVRPSTRPHREVVVRIRPQAEQRQGEVVGREGLHTTGPDATQELLQLERPVGEARRAQHGRDLLGPPQHLSSRSVHEHLPPATRAGCRGRSRQGSVRRTRTCRRDHLAARR